MMNYKRLGEIIQIADRETALEMKAEKFLQLLQE